jgi:2-polyprenyl-6-methoxyphenol hydroxylase-like FAD-dependent oxidoreductase
MNRRSILISGAGIAGPTLAFWLEAAGFRTTLIERAPALRAGGYVIDFWGLGYDIAERMGLATDIDRVGYHMRELRIVDDQGERMTGFGTQVLRELAGGRFVTLGRIDLSRLLFEKIKKTTEIIFDNEIIDLQEHADSVQVKFKNGADRRFGLVIGADGLHSNVRRLAFGSQDRFEKKLGYMVAAFEVHGYRPRDKGIYVTYSKPGWMLGRFALHGDRTLFLFVFVADLDAPPAMLDLPAQKAMLRERFREGKWECPRILDELERTQDLYFDSVSQIKMKSWSRGRIALVGDAAFCVSFLAGQGAALAVTAAYVLAGELAKAQGRHDVAFGKYEELLHAYIGAKQRGADRLGPAFAPKTRWGLLFRNQVIKLFAIPGLARFTFGRDIIDTLQLPDYRWPALHHGQILK